MRRRSPGRRQAALVPATLLARFDRAVRPGLPVDGLPMLPSARPAAPGRRRAALPAARWVRPQPLPHRLRTWPWLGGSRSTGLPSASPPPQYLGRRYPGPQYPGQRARVWELPRVRRWRERGASEPPPAPPKAAGGPVHGPRPALQRPFVRMAVADRRRLGSRRRLERPQRPRSPQRRARCRLRAAPARPWPGLHPARHPLRPSLEPPGVGSASRFRQPRRQPLPPSDRRAPTRRPSRRRRLCRTHRWPRPASHRVLCQSAAWPAAVLPLPVLARSEAVKTDRRRRHWPAAARQAGQAVGWRSH